MFNKVNGMGENGNLIDVFINSINRSLFCVAIYQIEQ